VPEGHVYLATSKSENERIIASSKLLPWIYAIKNGSVSTVFNFLYTMLSTEIRAYYFLFEYALLKSHEIPEIPEMVAAGFLSTRKTVILTTKDSDKVLKVLKTLLNTKIYK
jgi:hypothetical protein